MGIKKLSNRELLQHFKDAVCDNNYNPSSEPYNKSGFTYHELQSEILDRMAKDMPDDEESD